jgi:hypothetical protein
MACFVWEPFFFAFAEDFGSWGEAPDAARAGVVLESLVSSGGGRGEAVEILSSKLAPKPNGSNMSSSASNSFIGDLIGEGSTGKGAKSCGGKGFFAIVAFRALNQGQIKLSLEF